MLARDFPIGKVVPGLKIKDNTVINSSRILTIVENNKENLLKAHKNTRIPMERLKKCFLRTDKNGEIWPFCQKEYWTTIDSDWHVIVECEGLEL